MPAHVAGDGHKRIASPLKHWFKCGSNTMCEWETTKRLRSAAWSSETLASGMRVVSRQPEEFFVKQEGVDAELLAEYHATCLVTDMVKHRQALEAAVVDEGDPTGGDAEMREAAAGFYAF